jgi:Mrp family chromosome partitioning ATPase
MSELLGQLRTVYDLIVIDTAPLLLVADAMPLMRTVDGVIAVARLGMSTRDDAQHLRHELGSLGAETLGIVVNGVKASADAYYAYGYSREATERPTLERDRTPIW